MGIPLRDIQERRTFPYVNVALIVANFLAFFYELSLGPHLQGFLVQSAFVPSEYLGAGRPFAGTGSILISMFLHGGWAHIGGNMLYLWIFGDNVEDRLGHFRYLVAYLAMGWIASMSHALANPGSAVPSIGASGAIAGVLGAYLVLFPRARVLTLVPIGFFIRLAELPAILVLGFWFVLQIFNGAMSLGAASAQTTGVAWWAHIGGFAAGLVLGAILRVAGDRRAPA